MKINRTKLLSDHLQRFLEAIISIIDIVVYFLHEIEVSPTPAIKSCKTPQLSDIIETLH